MSLNIHKSFLINLAALFCMIPYVAPLPLDTDVQYPVVAVCALIFLLDVYKKNIRFNNFEWYFLVLSIVSFFYINPFNDFQYLIPKRVALLAAFVIFFVFSRYWTFINPKYLLAGVLINFSACILQLLIPDFFLNFVVFIGRHWSNNGIYMGKGLTGLSAEPAYLGGLSIAYFLVGYILWNERRISKKIFLVFSTVAIILNIFSFSGTSMFMMLIVIFTWFIFSKIALYHKLFYLLGILLVLSVFFNTLGDSYRSIGLVNDVIHNPLSITKDYSISMRLMSMAVGYESMIQGNIFGNGAGSLKFVATDIMEGTALNDLLIRAVGRERETFSSIGTYVTEFGLLFIILLIWLYSRALKSNYTNIVRIPIFLFILTAFSIMYPPFWMLMAATDKRANFYKNQFL